MIGLRISPDLTRAIDNWGSRQSDTPSRSEAIRRLVELGLAASAPARRLSPKSRAKAVDIAAVVIDRHADPMASDEEKAARKRRLLKGPREFRDIRKDHPAPKRKL